MINYLSWASHTQCWTLELYLFLILSKSQPVYPGFILLESKDRSYYGGLINLEYNSMQIIESW